MLPFRLFLLLIFFKPVYLPFIYAKLSPIHICLSPCLWSVKLNLFYPSFPFSPYTVLGSSPYTFFVFPIDLHPLYSQSVSISQSGPRLSFPFKNIFCYSINHALFPFQSSPVSLQCILCYSLSPLLRFFLYSSFLFSSSLLLLFFFFFFFSFSLFPFCFFLFVFLSFSFLFILLFSPIFLLFQFSSCFPFCPFILMLSSCFFIFLHFRFTF